MKIKIIFTLFFAVTIGLSSCSDGDFVKLDPEVTWENPAPIGFGVLLNANQLNATADVAGTFVYTPAEGTLLELGENQELSVEFIPKYPTAFNNVTRTVSIDVIDKGSSTANFSESADYGIMADNDGNAYKTIQIGDQIWMAQNLRTTKYRNGEDIPLVSSNAQWRSLTTGAYASYENSTDLDEIATFGLLYNWHAVSDSRNLAPEGWHVATQEDWNTLIAEVGGVSAAGQRLKESGNTNWSAGAASSNSSGFTALPTGRREYADGSFLNRGFNGFWWSNTPNGVDFSFYFQLNYDSNPIVAANFLRASGYAVRCVKDAE